MGQLSKERAKKSIKGSHSAQETKTVIFVA